MDKEPYAGTPFEVMDLLASFVGKTIVEISAYEHRRFGDARTGRFGGSSPGLELDSGEIVRFGMKDSVGAITVLLERGDDGVVYYDEYDDDDDYRMLHASDIDGGEPLVAQFIGTTIEQVEVLVLETSTYRIPWELYHERAVLFRCSDGRELVFAVGLDRDDPCADLPGVLLSSDISPFHWPHLCRLRVG